VTYLLSLSGRDLDLILEALHLAYLNDARYTYPYAEEFHRIRLELGALKIQQEASK
jgi:hypothetical protein